MAISIACLSDDLHSITISKTVFARALERGEVLTVTPPSGLNATYPYAYIHFLQADGHSYFIDNDGTGFTWAGGTFTYAIGSKDTMLDYDGILAIQIVLRDAVPPDTTKEWRSSVVKVTVDSSVFADMDSYSGVIEALVYNDLPATRVSLADTAGRYTGTNVETALAEIAGSGRTTETVKATYDYAVGVNDDLTSHTSDSSIHTSAAEHSKLAGIETGAQVNNISNADALDLTDSGTTTLHNHDDRYIQDAGYVHTDNNYTTTEKNKLAGIESGAEVNNISDTNATDLTDGGDTTLHIHDSRYYTESESDTKYVPKTDIGVTVQPYSANTVVDASYVHTDNNYTTAEKTKLSGIEAGAEVNQNTFSHIAVSGQTTIDADSKTDTLTLVAGTNISITTDAVTDAITIAASGTISVSAENTSITDAGGYYDATNVESALQELGAGGVPFDAVTLDTSAGFSASEGQLAWDSVFKTLDIGLANGSVLQVGQEILVYGKATATITNGQLIQLSGVQGNHNTFKPAVPAEYTVNPYLVLGLATNDIANGSFGYVTWFGKVHNVHTTGFNLFDPIWADPATTGGITATEPTAPNPKIKLGSVVELQTDGLSNGTFAIRPFFMPKLGGLQDVYLPSASGGNSLVYDGTDLRWEAKTLGYADVGASASAHAHGNITTDGKIGSTADLIVKTTTSGAVTALAAGTTSQYLRGDGTWNTPTGGQFLGTAVTKAIAYNSLTIAENITIPAGVGAYSAGEIEITSGYEVTVEAGSTWVIL